MAHRLLLPLVAALPLLALDTTSLSNKEAFFTALSLDDLRCAKSLLQQLPQDDPLTLDLTFCYLAHLGQSEPMRRLWQQGPAHLSKDTIEKICWAQLKKASCDPHPKIRSEALLAASLTHDARAIDILRELLSDPNTQLQMLALQIAQGFPDEDVQQAVLTLTTQGPPEIRIAAAQLLISWKSSDDVLLTMLEDENFSEKDHALLASLHLRLHDEPTLEAIEQAVVDKRAHMRMQAAICVDAHPTPEHLQALLPLLDDQSPSVQQQAIATLGLWQHCIGSSKDLLIEKAHVLLDAPSIELSAAAARALLLSTKSDRAKTWFVEKILHSTEQVSHAVLPYLIGSGAKGLDIAESILSTIEDPLCQLNLCAYLLRHRKALALAEKKLTQALEKTSFLLEEDKGYLVRSRLSHHPFIPRLPESHDMLARLQLLALKHYCGLKVPQEELEAMLTDRAWGIPMMAAGFLFQEMGSNLKQLLQPLLSHENEHIRIQAALLLTAFTESQEAVDELSKQLKQTSKEGKELVLLGFASLPVDMVQEQLLPLLFDESPTLCTRAAGVLLSSLYA